VQKTVASCYCKIFRLINTFYAIQQLIQCLHHLRLQRSKIWSNWIASKKLSTMNDCLNAANDAQWCKFRSRDQIKYKTYWRGYEASLLAWLVRTSKRAIFVRYCFSFRIGTKTIQKESLGGHKCVSTISFSLRVSRLRNNSTRPLASDCLARSTAFMP